MHLTRLHAEDVKTKFESPTFWGRHNCERGIRVTGKCRSWSFSNLIRYGVVCWVKAEQTCMVVDMFESFVQNSMGCWGLIEESQPSELICSIVWWYGLLDLLLDGSRVNRLCSDWHLTSPMSLILLGHARTVPVCDVFSRTLSIALL